MKVDEKAKFPRRISCEVGFAEPSKSEGLVSLRASQSAQLRQILFETKKDGKCHYESVARPWYIK